jgi:hypothetical protein
MTKILLIIAGIVLFLVIAYFYVMYKLMVVSALVLRSAGKMKTGNDLGEQVEDTLKNEKIPNFFQFYWLMWKRLRETEDNCKGDNDG